MFFLLNIWHQTLNSHGLSIKSKCVGITRLSKWLKYINIKFYFSAINDSLRLLFFFPYIPLFFSSLHTPGILYPHKAFLLNTMPQKHL